MQRHMQHSTLLVTLLAIILALLGSPVTMAAPIPTIPCSDLVVTGFTIVPVEPVQDISTAIAITVQNQGTCAAVPFVVQWKSEVLAQTGPTFQVPGLASNASTTINLTYAFPKAGNFLTIALLDTSNAVNETNETNNLAILSVSVMPPRPDLVITDFTIIPDHPVLGRNAQAVITVKNQGNSAATNFLVQWQPNLQTPDIAQQINALSPNESTSVTFDYTYPWFGSYLTRATVDGTSRVAESNETNNSAIKPVIVDPPLPDLVISDFALTPAPLVKGAVSTAHISVRNQGNTPAGAFMVQWKPNPFAPDFITQIDNLGVGETKTVDFDFTFLTNGVFDSEAIADNTGRVLELNEGNNSKRLSLSVQPSTVDLTITQLSIDPPAPRQGQQATVTMKVVNQGNSPATNFVVEWNPGALFLESQGASSLSKQVDSLGSGQEIDVQFQFTYVQSGNVRAIAKADAFNTIVETNEANNEALLNLTVASGIDLVITNITLNPDPVIRGSKTLATITVQNQGIFPAGSFFVQWKPNADTNLGPVAQIDGLNAGESKDVVLDSVYFAIGTFTTVATADTFNQVIESDETNNTFTRGVTVEPRKTTVEVTFRSIHVIEAFEDSAAICIDCDGEWRILSALLDSTGTCDATINPGDVIPNIHINQKGFQCHEIDENSVNDGDTLDISHVFNVTLVESTPLVLGVAAIQDGDGIAAPDFAGFVLQLYFPTDLQGTKTFTIPGERGQCGGGHCFDVTYDIKVVNPPPALATNAAIEPTPIVQLPSGFARFVPTDAQLPAGVQRQYEVYLPSLRNN